MRKTIPIAVTVVVSIAAALIAAAQATGQPAKPSPEVQKLAYFVGTWKYEGETKAGDFGPAGKFSGEESCEWFTGGYQVVCHTNESSTIGKSTGMSVMAYDAEEKIYTFYSISSRGENFHGSATFTGSTMTITWEGTMGGKPAKVRGTIMEALAHLPFVSRVLEFHRTSVFCRNLSVLLASGVPLTTTLRILADLMATTGRFSPRSRSVLTTAIPLRLPASSMSSSTRSIDESSVRISSAPSPSSRTTISCCRARTTRSTRAWFVSLSST